MSYLSPLAFISLPLTNDQRRAYNNVIKNINFVTLFNATAKRALGGNTDIFIDFLKSNVYDEYSVISLLFYVYQTYHETDELIDIWHTKKLRNILLFNNEVKTTLSQRTIKERIKLYDTYTLYTPAYDKLLLLLAYMTTQYRKPPQSIDTLLHRIILDNLLTQDIVLTIKDDNDKSFMIKFNLYLYVLSTQKGLYLRELNAYLSTFVDYDLNTLKTKLLHWFLHVGKLYIERGITDEYRTINVPLSAITAQLDGYSHRSFSSFNTAVKLTIATVYAYHHAIDTLIDREGFGYFKFPVNTKNLYYVANNLLEVANKHQKEALLEVLRSGKRPLQFYKRIGAQL